MEKNDFVQQYVLAKLVKDGTRTAIYSTVVEAFGLWAELEKGLLLESKLRELQQKTAVIVFSDEKVQPIIAKVKDRYEEHKEVIKKLEELGDKINGG